MTGKLEARSGIEPPMRVLQTHALPLGYRAIRSYRKKLTLEIKNPPAKASGGGPRFPGARKRFLAVQPPHARKHTRARETATVWRGPEWVGEHGNQLSHGVRLRPTQNSNPGYRTHASWCSESAIRVFPRGLWTVSIAQACFLLSAG